VGLRWEMKHRSDFVLSPRSYSAKSSLALFMPITKRQKGYPFEVLLPADLQTQGVILADQIKCLDWKARNIRFVESVPKSIIEEVQAKIEPLLL
jgi:mRNA interferase MazF